MIRFTPYIFLVGVTASAVWWVGSLQRDNLALTLKNQQLQSDLELQLQIIQMNKQTKSIVEWAESRSHAADIEFESLVEDAKKQGGRDAPLLDFQRYVIERLP